MKAQAHLWVSAANINIPEVLMAAVRFQRTVEAFMRVCCLSPPTSKGYFFFPKYSESVISFQTPCGQIQMWTRNNTLILPNILADMHMPLFQLHLNCWDSSKTACHVTHTLRFSLWILANGSSDCLFRFKQMTTHRPDLCFETFLVMFSSFTEFDVSQNI